MYVLMYTVSCRYNVVQYNILSYTALRFLRQNINQKLNSQKISHSSHSRRVCRVGGFSKVVATFIHVGRSFNNFMALTGWCLYNPIFSNLGLCAACWAHFMCRHELWSTSVSHLYSSLNTSLGLAAGKYHQKITIIILKLVPQHFALPGCFPYFLAIVIFSPRIFLVGLSL